MRDYKFLRIRGALGDAEHETPVQRAATATTVALDGASIAPEVLALIPEALARTEVVIPLDFDGETITFAAADAGSIALADKLRFMLAKNVRLVPAPRERILRAIERYYPDAESESVACLLSELPSSPFA